MTTQATHAIVNNEDCDLHYWYQGSGPLIVFVPGGNGHARQYYAIMALLADRFTVCTYDRRQNSASTVKVNKTLSVPQQSRDALAVMKAVGFEKATFFGSSLGGIIVLELAREYPHAVEHVIGHEPPVVSLLPDAAKVVDFIMSCVDVYRETGEFAAAQKRFDAAFVGIYGNDLDPSLPPTLNNEPWNKKNFWDNEVVSAMYVPDWRPIIANKVSVGIMTGARSGDAFYARTTYELEKVLGCLRMTVPGHHSGYEGEAKEFLPVFLEMLDLLEKRKRERSG